MQWQSHELCIFQSLAERYLDADADAKDTMALVANCMMSRAEPFRTKSYREY